MAADRPSTYYPNAKRSHTYLYNTLYKVVVPFVPSSFFIPMVRFLIFCLFSMTSDCWSKKKKGSKKAQRTKSSKRTISCGMQECVLVVEVLSSEFLPKEGM
jgi:hypothetical protein